MKKEDDDAGDTQDSGLEELLKQWLQTDSSNTTQIAALLVLSSTVQSPPAMAMEVAETPPSNALQQESAEAIGAEEGFFSASVRGILPEAMAMSIVADSSFLASGSKKGKCILEAIHCLVRTDQGLLADFIRALPSAALKARYPTLPCACAFSFDLHIQLRTYFHSQRASPTIQIASFLNENQMR